MKLKVIDISKPHEEILGGLLEAAMEQGFLLIDGHNFSEKEVEEMYGISEEFFSTVPLEEKLRYPINSRNFGYTYFTNENLDSRKGKDFKEAYNFSQINFETGELNQGYDEVKNVYKAGSEDNMPDFFRKRENAIKPIVQKLHENARKIVRLLSLAMGVEDAGFFVDSFIPWKPSSATFRLLHYPLFRENNSDGSGEADGDIRAGAHTDYGAVTLLFQREGEGGLQLQLNDDQWMDVDFVPSAYRGSAPPLVVNFGDMMSYWTNGVLRSTMHRVKFSPGTTRNSDRYSIVFFAEPENNTKLLPVPSKLVQERRSQEDLPVITSLEHLRKRLKETYTTMEGSY